MAGKIQRYLGEKTLEAFKSDFSFLIKMVCDSYGEYDLQIRNGYVNIYYKGNSLAKITPKLSTNEYEFSVNVKFELNNAVKSNFTGMIKQKGDYHVARVPRNLVRSFFQKNTISSLARKIKKVNYCEEITFEQSLITDNLGRQDFVIIDRQVEYENPRGRIDLLALRQIKDNKYCFVILEVKLGNNDELSGKVADQLKGYIKYIQDNIRDFKECYEKNYEEKFALGIFADDMPEKIIIDDTVEGRIVVGLYSGIGKKKIEELIKEYPYLENSIRYFWHEI